MPIGVFAALLGLAVLLTIGSALYLLIHARAVAALFSKPGNEVEPGPGRRAPRGRLWLAILVFSAGTAGSLGMWFLSGIAPDADAVRTQPAEVKRP